jgi:hypothetical protein
MNPRCLFVLMAVFSSWMGLAPLSGFAIDAHIGKIIVQQPTVLIERNGKDILISAFGALLREGDIVKTGPDGKALITFSNGSEVLLASDTQLVVESPIPQTEIRRLILRVFGKIRARIQRTRERQIQITTRNAVIGIKGTDFVVEFRHDITTVATVTGLVNLTSVAMGSSIDIPPGKMTSIAADGQVMPLREIAGDILSDVEIAGEKASEEDISGRRID